VTAGTAPAPRRTSREAVRASAGAGDLLFGISLFVVALALRLAAAFTLAAEPVWDGHYYDFGARRIASGFGYADEVMRGGQLVWHPWCHYPVGYSGYLAAFYKIFGPTAGAAHAANALAGALLAVVTFLLAREALSPLRAKLAGALVALHPGLVLYGALVMTEPLSALLVLASFWVTLRLTRTRGPRAGVVLGALVLGIAALVRPQALLCAPFLALAAGIRAPRAPRRWLAFVAYAALACVVALVPVLPWTARNCRVMDGCALVSTNAGWNLAIGAFPRATGRFETLRSDDGCREVTGQVQQDRCWFAYGVGHIRRDPWRWLRLVPAKLAFTFDHESFAVEYLREARPRAWPEERRVRMRGIVTTVHRVLVCAAALGFVAFAIPRARAPRGGSLLGALVQLAVMAGVAFVAYAGFTAGTPTFWPLVIIACVLPCVPLPGRPAMHPGLALPLVLLATTALAHAVFFGEDRYHVVATPALAVLAAAALRPPRTRAARSPVGGRAAR